MQRQPARPELDPRQSTGPNNLVQIARPSPSLAPQISPYQTQQSISPAPPYHRPTPYPQSSGAPQHAVPPHTPIAQQSLPYATHQQLHPSPGLAAAPATGYAPASSTQAYNRPLAQPVQSHGPYGTNPNLPLGRDQDVFVLPDSANNAIPADLRSRFPQDDQGRVLFFTKPPVVHETVIYDKVARGSPKRLAHSERYLAAKKEREEMLAGQKRGLVEGRAEREVKRPRHDTAEIEHVGLRPRAILEYLKRSTEDWVEKLKAKTEADYRMLYGDECHAIQEQDRERRQRQLQKAEQLEAQKDRLREQCRNTPEQDLSASRNLWATEARGERY